MGVKRFPYFICDFVQKILIDNQYYDKNNI